MVAAPPRALEVLDLGLMDYRAALARQRALREERIAAAVPDTLLLVEHPSTFTLGRRGAPGDFRVPPDVLRARGFHVEQVERGGRVTYHGPGQLVGYPIVSLRDAALSAPAYVRCLEQSLVHYLDGLGLHAELHPGFPGVWVAGRKIAAVGVHLKRWVSIHGFALNLDPDLAHFDAIVPCGLVDARVTSVRGELGRAPPLSDAKVGVTRELRRSLGYPPA